MTGIVGGTTISGTDAEETISGTAGDDLLEGKNGSDVISGNAGNDTIYGGGGADFLLGGKGDDYVHGGTGQDTLYGGIGNDTLVGGSGADYLSGDFGSDILIGGTGDDTFAFNFATVGFDETGNYASDTITDFAAGDMIELSGFFTASTPALAIVGWQDGANVILGVDVDGDSVVDYEIATVQNADLTEVWSSLLYA